MTKMKKNKILLLSSLASVGLVGVMATTNVALTAPTAPHCTVVYDGDPGVLEHEIAHCHGWKHPNGNPNSTIHEHPRAPVEFRKPYPNVTIYRTHPLILIGTGRTEASKLCENLTGEDYSSPYLSSVRGCAFGGYLK